MKVNRFMKRKIDEELSLGTFDLSSYVGICCFCTHLVGELQSFVHVNKVAKECLTTETVQEEFGGETMLEEDYKACELSAMEIPGIFLTVDSFFLYCFVCLFFAIKNCQVLVKNLNFVAGMTRHFVLAKRIARYF